MTDAVLLAGGHAARFKLGRDKLWEPIAGIPVWLHSARALNRHPGIDRIVIVVRDETAPRFQNSVQGLNKLAAVVIGGATRQESCARGLEAARGERVLVHDAARPNISASLLDRLLLTTGADATIPVIPLLDTIKQVHNDVVVGTVSREGLYRSQTPQVCRLQALRSAHHKSSDQTDEAAAIESIGGSVRVVPGDPANLKVTTSEDLEILRKLMDESPTIRTGIGYDIHRFGPGLRLVIGGIEIPEADGLAGHSDADVLTHAICDALLGAAGMPDIGVLFPNTDPAYAGIDSQNLAVDVAARLAAAGWRTENVDSTVVAERPKISGYVPAMRERLAKSLGVQPDRVNVKATTNEGLGALGAAEGIAAYAIATIIR